MMCVIIQNVSLLQPNLVVERCSFLVMTVLIQTFIHIQRESFVLIQIVSFLLKNHWKILKKVGNYLVLCHCCNRILVLTIAFSVFEMSSRGRMMVEMASNAKRINGKEDSSEKSGKFKDNLESISVQFPIIIF